MGFVKGTDGIARTVRNPLEGSVGDIALDSISAATVTASGNITATAIIANSIVADGNVEIAANSLVWIFNASGLNGELVLPTGEGVIKVMDDTISLVSLNTSTGNANSVYLGSSGGLGFFDGEIGGNWLQIFRSGVEPEITVPVGPGSANLYINNSSDGNVRIWNFDATGTLTAPGNITASGLLIDTVTGITANAGNIDINQITGLGGYLNATGALFSGNVTGNTAGFAIGYRDIPQVSFTANTTIAAADAGKHFYSTESTNYVLTIANNSAVSWPVGTAVTVVNRGTGNITVAQAAGVSLYLAGNSSAGNRTVTTYGMATLLNVAANVWMINGTGVS